MAVRRITGGRFGGKREGSDPFFSGDRVRFRRRGVDVICVLGTKGSPGHWYVEGRIGLHSERDMVLILRMIK